MSDKEKEKLSYKERTGKTRVGTFLEGIVSVSPALLEVASLVTGVDGLSVLADKIRGEGGGLNNGLGLSDFQRDLALKELEADISEQKQITKRWEADMNSDSWLAKNVRPMLVINFAVLIDVVVCSYLWGKPIAEAILPLVITMGTTTIGGYFMLREFGKDSKLRHK